MRNAEISTSCLKERLLRLAWSYGKFPNTKWRSIRTRCRVSSGGCDMTYSSPVADFQLFLSFFDRITWNWTIPQAFEIYIFTKGLKKFGSRVWLCLAVSHTVQLGWRSRSLLKRDKIGLTVRASWQVVNTGWHDSIDLETDSTLHRVQNM